MRVPNCYQISKRVAVALFGLFHVMDITWCLSPNVYLTKPMYGLNFSSSSSFSLRSRLSTFFLSSFSCAVNFFNCVWPKDSYQTFSIRHGLRQHCNTVNARAKSLGVTLLPTAPVQGFRNIPQLECMKMVGMLPSSCSSVARIIVKTWARVPWREPTHLKMEASVRENLCERWVRLTRSSVAWTLLSADALVENWLTYVLYEASCNIRFKTKSWVMSGAKSGKWNLSKSFWHD